MNEKQDIEILVRLLIEENTLLHEEVSQLKERISYPEFRLLQYEHSKDNSNSSIPPSRNLHRIKRTESLREKNLRNKGLLQRIGNNRTGYWKIIN
jgi:regulator of replication initiation timing